jgi:LmbE family N-acetylglucosaminyl deacetylase
MSSGLGAVSPHLDDLALSCSGLLGQHPGSLMVTVFAGGPASVDPVTGWESRSGIFEPGADIVATRRREDVRASSILGATFHHLDQWDHQYRNAAYGYSGPTEPAALTRSIALELETLIQEADREAWVIPLGLSHPDHEIAAKACLEVAGGHPDVDWLVYAELPYAVYQPQKVDDAVADLRRMGIDLRPFEGTEASPDTPTKERVVRCYRSQVIPLAAGVGDTLNAREQIYRISRP